MVYCFYGYLTALLFKLKISISERDFNHVAIAAFTSFHFNYVWLLINFPTDFQSSVKLISHLRMKFRSQSAFLFLVTWKEESGKLPNTSLFEHREYVEQKRPIAFEHISSQKFKLLEAAHLFYHLTMKLRKSVFVLIVILGYHDAQIIRGIECQQQFLRERLCMFMFLFFLMRESIHLQKSTSTFPQLCIKALTSLPIAIVNSRQFRLSLLLHETLNLLLIESLEMCLMNTDAQAPG